MPHGAGRIAIAVIVAIMLLAVARDREAARIHPTMRPRSRPPLPPSLVEHTRREIEQRQYAPTMQELDWLGRPMPARAHFVNPAQGLRAYFDASGAEIMPQSRASDPWRLRMATTSAGRPSSQAAVAPDVPAIDGRRISYSRDAAVEWYVNSAEGIEQSFSFPSPPPGDGPLVVEIEFDGDIVEMHQERDRVRFTMVDGRDVEYGHLVSVDASGRRLPSQLVTYGRRVQLRTDDADATYPVTVDPLLVSPQWTSEGNQGGSSGMYMHFASTVAFVGDVNDDGYEELAVGASGFDSGQTDEGAVFVFFGTATGFPVTDVPGESLAGTPEPDAGWAVESNSAFSNFGTSISGGDLNGDGYSDVAIGADTFNNGTIEEGAVFVFYGSATGLPTANSAGGLAGIPSPDASWAVESDQAFARLGTSVAVGPSLNEDGAVPYADLAVGSPRASASAGGVFVFYGSSTGLSTANTGAGLAGSLNPDAGWAAESAQAWSGFGSAVTISGGIRGSYGDLIVGAPQYDSGQTDEGAVFAFYGSSSGLPTADGGAGLAGSTTPDSSWAAESNQATSGFGVSVSAGGDVNGDTFSDLLVGADLYDAGQSDEGVVFLYTGAAAGLTVVDAAGGLAGATAPDATWAAESNQASAAFGRAVTIAGNFNADGYDDLAVGSPQYDGSTANEGSVFVFNGSALGPSTADTGTGLAGASSPDAQWAAIGGHPSWTFGATVSGSTSLAVGAPTGSGGMFEEGLVFVYYGSGSGLPTTETTTPFEWRREPVPDASWAANGQPEGSRFGSSVGAGDFNGDGYEDIVVGAPYFDNGQVREGAAFVYFGSASGLPVTDVLTTGLGRVSPDSSWCVESNMVSALLGSSVAGRGSYNGDVYDDVVVGCYGFANGQGYEGAVFVFHGSPSGLPTSEGAAGTRGMVSPDASWAAESNTQSTYFGHSVCGIGSVNGDSYDDLAVGAPGYGSGAGEQNEGAVFVFYGTATGFATSDSAGSLAGNTSPDAQWAVQSDNAGARMGESVGGRGSVNGDAYSDLLVGAPSFSFGESSEGAAFVFHGSAAGLPTGNSSGGLLRAPNPDASWAVESDVANARLGNSVAILGSVNGDAYADVGVAMMSLSSLDPAVFVYHGSSAGLPTVDSAGGLIGRTAPDASWALWSGMQAFSLTIAPGPADVHGDGIPDLILGASGMWDGPWGEGAVFVYAGSPSGLSTYDFSPGGGGFGALTADPDVLGQSDLFNAHLGAAVAVADVNGDGADDVIASSATLQSPADEGGVFVYLADPTPAVAGSVNDGSGADIDYQSSATSLSVNWSGFTDPQSGIAYYEWAVGTTAGGANVVPWTYAGTAQDASASLSLVHGQRYYASVRARNGWGCFTGVTSDGVTVDTTGPTISLIDDGDYQPGPTSLSASWSASDAESPIAKFEWAIGTTPGGTTVYPFTDVGTSTSAAATGLTLSHGSMYYVTVRATNVVGLTTTSSSDGVVIDMTPAVGGSVADGDSGVDIDAQASLGTISATWSGFDDVESGIVAYSWAIGTTPSGTQIQGFTPVGASTSATNAGVTLVTGVQYYVTVRCTNGAGLDVDASSDGVVADATPPMVGFINDGSYQTSTTIRATWLFTDPESDIAGYEWAIGTAPGLDDLQPFTSTGLTAGGESSIPSLTAGNTYYVTVRATNGAGLSTVSSSDGVRVQVLVERRQRCGLLGMEVVLVIGVFRLWRRRREREDRP